jgi:hypothetical protein
VGKERTLNRTSLFWVYDIYINNIYRPCLSSIHEVLTVTDIFVRHCGPAVNNSSICYLYSVIKPKFTKWLTTHASSYSFVDQNFEF